MALLVGAAAGYVVGTALGWTWALVKCLREMKGTGEDSDDANVKKKKKKR